MRKFLASFTLVLGGLLLSSLSWGAHTSQQVCHSATSQVTGVATAAWHLATVDFLATKSFHATPLITTTVEVTEPGSCLVVQFAPRAHPGRFPLVYQIRVNGVPMPGQRRNLYVVGAPLAFEQPADNTGAGVVWPLANYVFLQVVNPGVHRVEVFYAVACLHRGDDCARTIDGATLIVGYE